ncbi:MULTISPECIES: hypothetical protein [unclassified Variovorax]|jgi:UDP:flavonoid glycosyltransferase YjiC (YdhE family)|uniref:glycosyltransferase n=1 Tax=unclassified Variovorax TaxID=663243 RepID=UPI000F7E5828|nr:MULTISPECIES: hypothetical protein [unclassified Variovorax]RSZ31143.1 hypothetical protein EJO70_31585 [Variovorax sp. 553]RSZ31556.1 hypothetical protein EJO71_31585 [Variovorax sp. 679]
MTSNSIASPHILVAWEHGRNLGHLVRSSEIANLIRTRGGTVAWAVPPQHVGHPMIAGRGESVHVAPTFAQPAIPGVAVAGQEATKRLSSFADVLLALGFHDALAVEIAVTRWLKLFAAVQPTAILCDYAPLALLAACVAGIPATQITNGFDAPPVDFPLFDSTVRGPYLERVNAQKIAQLDQTVTRVGRILGATGLRLADFMAWPSVVVDGIPETDPYGARANALYIGPFASSAPACAPSWPGEEKDEKGKRVFVYLRGRETVAVLEVLQSWGLATLCLWPDASEGEFSRFDGTSVRVTREPQNLSMVLGRADAVINYGSSGFLNATLLVGKPQLMLPTDMEKLMFARRVERQGAGLAWHAAKGNLRWAIDWVLNHPALTDTARCIARRYDEQQLDRQRDVFLDQLTGNAQGTQCVSHAEGVGVP